MASQWLNYHEAAARLGVAYETFRHRRAGTDAIPRVKMGRRRLVAEDDLNAFMAQRERQAQQRARNSLKKGSLALAG